MTYKEFKALFGKVIEPILARFSGWKGLAIKLILQYGGKWLYNRLIAKKKKEVVPAEVAPMAKDRHAESAKDTHFYNNRNPRL